MPLPETVVNVAALAAAMVGVGAFYAGAIRTAAGLITAAFGLLAAVALVGGAHWTAVFLAAFAAAPLAAIAQHTRVVRARETRQEVHR